MRSLLLLTAVAAILLCAQLPHIVVSAKKPSRPLPNGQRPSTKSATVGTKGKPQRPLSRKVSPPTSEEEEEEEVDELDSLDVVTPDDDENEDRNVVATTRPRKSSPQKLSPGRPNNNNNRNQNRPPPSLNDDDDDDEDEVVEDDYDYEEEEEEDDEYSPPPTRQQQQRGRPGRIQQRPAFVGDRRPRNHQSPQQQQRQSPSRNGRNHNNRPGPPRRAGRVVPYRKPSPPNGAAAVLAQGWSGLVSALPDPAIVKEAAISSLNAAKQTTSSLSANIYREVKGLTSSELEQVMLKATRPDDTAVKGKHVERLVGVTYQISARYDIYDAVLRKLWSKMAEKDWRTTIKALYILHRFAADGSPEHAVALKTRLRELRRTRDPKRKDKFFNSKQLIAGDTSPENVKFRAFMARYAHYVLLRAQYFSGMFEEISSVPSVKSEGKKRAPPKPITATSLRSENYNAAELLLKAGLACHLKDGEVCENTAIAAERVTADMMSLTSAVAVALNRVLKDSIPKGTDQKLIQQWCTLYSQQLLPQTKAMVKKMSPNLDAFGLFLPSRMSASVPPNLLEKGLKLAANNGDDSPDEVTENVDAETVETNAPAATSSSSENDRNEKDNVAKTKTSTVPVDDDDDDAVDTAGEDEEEEEGGGDEEEVEDEEYEYDDEDGDGDDEEEYEEDD